MLDISLDENLETRFSERARQQRPRRDRVAAAPGHRAPRPRRLGRARQPAVRRVLRDRPARQLGARQGRHAARARDPQADRRTGRGVRPRRPRHARVGKAADVVVFDERPIAPGPLRRIRDFPADGERLVADQPVGVEPRARERHGDPRERVRRHERAGAASGPVAAHLRPAAQSSSGTGPGARTGCCASRAGKPVRSWSPSATNTPRTRNCSCAPLSSGVSTGATGAPAGTQPRHEVVARFRGDGGCDRVVALVDAVESFGVRQAAKGVEMQHVAHRGPEVVLRDHGKRQVATVRGAEHRRIRVSRAPVGTDREAPGCRADRPTTRSRRPCRCRCARPRRCGCDSPMPRRCTMPRRSRPRGRRSVTRGMAGSGTSSPRVATAPASA